MYTASSERYDTMVYNRCGKNASSANTQSYQAAPAPAPSADAGDGFMNIPDGIDEELPFN